MTLSSAQGTTNTVTYTLAGTGGATLGTDTTAQPITGTLTFAPGEISKSIVLAATFDTLVEIGEGVSLTLSAPSAGTALSTTAATTTIALLDPAAPTFTLTSNAVAGAANEEGSVIVYTITPSSVTDKAYTFTLNTVGKALGGVALASAADFSPASQTVTFAAGTTTAQTVSQTVFNDGITEGLEGYETSLLSSTFTVVGNALSGLISDPTSGGSGLSGTTFTLLSTVDNIPGTNGNDTFLGTVTDVPAATDTLTAADNLNGGLGIDTLSITVSGVAAANTIPAATVTAIENINVRALQTTAATITSVTATNFTGATAFSADRATSAVTFNALAAGQSVGVIGNANVLNGAVNANYANTVTAGVFNISGGTIGGALNPNAVLTETGTGITSNTINSTGAANSLNNVVLSGASNAALTINAATNLSTGNITGFTGTTSTITVAGAAASVNIGIVEAATVRTINASGLTAGGVTATLNAQTLFNFTGGQGNDLVTLASVLVTGGMVDAGAGTADRLTITDTTFVTPATAPFIKGFEVLQATGGLVSTTVTVDATILATNNTINAVRIADGAGATGLTGLSALQAANATIASSGLNAAGSSQITIGITGATGVQTDTLTAGVTTTTATGVAQNQNLAGISLAGIEIVNLTGSGVTTAATGSIVFDASVATVLSSLTFTNAGNGNVLNVNNATGTNLIVNASNSAGTTTIVASGYGGTTGADLRGGSGNDVIYGSARGDVINGGAGNDFIYADATTAGTAEIQTVTFTNTATGGAGTVTVGGVATNLVAGSSTAQSSAAVVANATAIMTANPTIVSIADAGGSVTITYLQISGNVPTNIVVSTTVATQTVASTETTQGIAPTNVGGTAHAGADILTGGLGNDTFFFTAGGAVGLAASITDLNLGTNVVGGQVDVINIASATAGNAAAATGTVPVLITLSAAQQTTVTNSATLAAAVDAVLLIANTVNNIAQFTYGVDTYLIHNGATANAAFFATQDTLIKITGVSGILDATDVIIVA